MTLFSNFTPFAMKSIAARARPVSAKAFFCFISGLVLASGCSVIDKPMRASLYDFGPGIPAAAVASPAAAPLAPLAPLAIADVTTAGGALDSQGVLYRLAYTDIQQLRPYAQARWTMPPAQLVRQRLREKLGERRVVFNAREGVALNRGQNPDLRMLRLELEEFSHLFTAPNESVGLVRLHATLVQLTPAGERLVGQRELVVRRPAATPDAPGGVRALTAATDAAIDEIDAWLRQLPAP